MSDPIIIPELKALKAFANQIPGRLRAELYIAICSNLLMEVETLLPDLEERARFLNIALTLAMDSKRLMLERGGGDKPI